jgi:DNA-binding CsgD family transcriptional regulator
MFALLSSRRSQVHLFHGAIPDAIADARAAIDAGMEFDRLLPDLCAALIDAQLEAGDIDGAEQALLTIGVGEEIPRTPRFLELFQSRGRLRLAQGDAQAGIKDLLAGCELLVGPGIASPASGHCRSNTAIALARVGRYDEARQLLDADLDAARRFGAHSAVGISLRATGMITGGSAGLAYLREAVGHLEQSPARLEHARALAELGAALRRTGKRREAQQTLRQALDLADRCGGQAVARQARAELMITGARPRRARLAGVEALTASERRVAQLAAQGMTNRQIAQALFVSQPTIVTHLSHCYQKLNITSRQQLTGVLGQEPERD